MSTDGHTHTHTRTDAKRFYYLCPMQYAIAMGQIIIIKSCVQATGLDLWSVVSPSPHRLRMYNTQMLHTSDRSLLHVNANKRIRETRSLEAYGRPIRWVGTVPSTVDYKAWNMRVSFENANRTDAWWLQTPYCELASGLLMQPQAQGHLTCWGNLVKERNRCFRHLLDYT